jgi:DNA-directed RNA polymerase subunit M/transcription elongation factor TFIIS
MNNSLDDPIRLNIVGKLEQFVDKYDALIIEQSIYNYCIEHSIHKNISRNWNNKLFKSFYINKVISIYSNIDEKSYIKNTYLIKLIKNKKINLKKIATMSRYDIFPDRWNHLIEEKIRKDKILSEMKPNEMTDQIRCNKCGGRKCSYYAVQTRSADEPMTMFITCLSCNSKWKQ